VYLFIGLKREYEFFVGWSLWPSWVDSGAWKNKLY